MDIKLNELLQHNNLPETNLKQTKSYSKYTAFIITKSTGSYTVQRGDLCIVKYKFIDNSVIINNNYSNDKKKINEKFNDRYVLFNTDYINYNIESQILKLINDNNSSVNENDLINIKNKINKLLENKIYITFTFNCKHIFKFTLYIYVFKKLLSMTFPWN